MRFHIEAHEAALVRGSRHRKAIVLVLSQTFGRDEQGQARRIKSSRKRIELLREAQFARGLQLSFADHVHELNAREGDGG
jgi:hypothetical protein